MLIGAVPYVNAIPLIRGLGYEIRKVPPAALDRLLRIGEIDLATAPITVLFEHPQWRAIPGIAIGTAKSARSVLLCTRSKDVTIENVQSIYLDMESCTSSLLLKVLLASKYQRPLEEIQFVTPIPSPDIEAKLIIGDKALRERIKPSWSGNIYDLGREWTEWIQLPFVFACWVTPKQSISLELGAKLQRTLRSNLQSLDQWIGDVEGFDTKLLREYFTENMNYGFGRLEQQGLMTFHQYLRDLELVDKPFDIRFVNP